MPWVAFCVSWPGFCFIPFAIYAHAVLHFFFFLFLGHRSDSCRLYEMQAFLVELISNFEFAITEDIKRLRREPCLVMVPVLEGELEKGAQLPLRVSIAQRECE